MKAKQLINELTKLVDIYGDLPVRFDEGLTSVDVKSVYAYNKVKSVHAYNKIGNSPNKEDGAVEIFIHSVL